MVTMSKSKEIRDLLERILSFAAKRAEVHFQFAKEKEVDGAMFFTEDYKAYVSILDDATTVLDLLKQQPIEGESTKKVRTILADLLHDGRPTGYILDAEEINEIRRVCDRLDRAKAENKDVWVVAGRLKETIFQELAKNRLLQASLDSAEARLKVIPDKE